MPNAVEPPSESPSRLETAYALLADADGAPWRPLAGGTDLMVQLTGEIGEPPARILDIWRLDELRGIGVERDALVIGALTTYTEIRRSPLVAEFVPALADAAATIGAAQIQNRGTIGGNAINASPAGDTLPVLLAVGATFVLGSANGERSVAADDFWPAYRSTARRPHPARGRSAGALPEGRHAPSAGDQQGRRRPGLGGRERRGGLASRSPRPRIRGRHPGSGCRGGAGARGGRTDP
jgi:xanthine dehydrogenase iron-sulfur cluster and FAD-binding subunit A